MITAWARETPDALHTKNDCPVSLAREGAAGVDAGIPSTGAHWNVFQH
jgi:hypothetical protein